MKANRVLYLVLLFLSFVFVYFHGGKVPYMLFYTVAILPVVSLINMLIGYVGFRYKQSLDRDIVVKGEKVTYTLEINNKGIIMIPYVTIRFLEGSGEITKQKDIRNISLGPLSNRTFCYELTYNYRGSYDLGVRSIQFQDFLGIFRLTRKHSKPVNVVVKPKLITLDHFALTSYNFADQISSQTGMYEDVSNIEHIDPYNYGDSLKKVHWKLTAKVNELMIKKYSSMAASSVTLVVDLNKTRLSHNHIAVEDKHMEAVVAILWHCIHKGVSVKLVYYDGQMQTFNCNNLVDFEMGYQILATIEFSQTVELSNILNNQMNERIQQSDLILSTSNLDDALYQALSRQKSAGYSVRVVYIQPEAITEQKKLDVERIISALTASEIRVYTINISDDISKLNFYR